MAVWLGGLLGTCSPNASLSRRQFLTAQRFWGVLLLPKLSCSDCCCSKSYSLHGSCFDWSKPVPCALLYRFHGCHPEDMLSYEESRSLWAMQRQSKAPSLPTSAPLQHQANPFAWGTVWACWGVSSLQQLQKVSHRVLLGAFPYLVPDPCFSV